MKTKTEEKMKTAEETKKIIAEELHKNHLDYMIEELNFDEDWIERNVTDDKEEEFL